MNFNLKSLTILFLIGLLVLVCGCTGAQVVQPTAQVIYVTVTPSPTPQIIYVTVTPQPSQGATQQPTIENVYTTPTPAPTPAPTPTETPFYPISGMVYDRNSYGVSSATVKLWQGSSLYSSPDNPQITTSDGHYTFYRIPPGSYTITVEKVDSLGNNHNSGSQSVIVSSGAIAKDIYLSDYPPATPTPTPAPVSHTVAVEVARVSSNSIYVKNMGGSGAQYLTGIHVVVNSIEVSPTSGQVTSTIGSLAYYPAIANSQVTVTGDFTDGDQVMLWSGQVS